MKERTRLDGHITATRQLERDLADNLELIALGQAEHDDATILEAEVALIALSKDAKKKELNSLLSGEVDGNNAYLEINAGAGGTEAQDWGEMMLRMYMRWCDQHKYKYDIVEYTDGDEAGIKSATLFVKASNAYGWLKTETGVHRLVRISPFDSGARRHTSFAAVMCTPELDDTIEITVLDKDLRVDTYRAQGAGGQHVNKTDSAVRLTHLPTGIAVACQQERSQIQNRAKAMAMLKARLYELEMKKKEAQISSYTAGKTEIGWGRQIRSYVLQPYQMIKDLRTGVATSDTQGVLNGDLDQFMSAALAASASGKGLEPMEDLE